MLITQQHVSETRNHKEANKNESFIQTKHYDFEGFIFENRNYKTEQEKTGLKSWESDSTLNSLKVTNFNNQICYTDKINYSSISHLILLGFLIFFPVC